MDLSCVVSTAPIVGNLSVKSSTRKTAARRLGLKRKTRSGAIKEKPNNWRKLQAVWEKLRRVVKRIINHLGRQLQQTYCCETKH